MKYIFLLVIGVLCCTPQRVWAIPPPEFIIQFTSQIVPLFGLFFAFLLGVGGAFVRYVRSISVKTLIFCGIGIFVLALVAAYVVNTCMLRRQLDMYGTIFENQMEQYNQAQETSGSRSTDVVLESPQVAYIKTYYDLLGQGDIQAAYTMTRQEVEYETFFSWYKDTTQIDIEKIEPTGQDHFSVRLVLYEGDVMTVYGVLVSVPMGTDNTPQYFDSEEVVILGDGAQYVTTTFAVSNEEFRFILSSHPDAFVLDAREQVEYTYGHFPGSTHIKFADLEDNDGWNMLPHDVPVYVFCWSGIRGSMVVDFLREKGIDAYYLEDGAKGWVDAGGDWIGEISFKAVYNQPQYQRVYTRDQFNELREDGVVIVDSRDNVPDTKRIVGSFPIRLMYTPTRDIDTTIQAIPVGSSIISVCDDYVDCFDARLIGVELEARGYSFLGRYLFLEE